MTRSNERASLAGILEGRRRVTTSSGRFLPRSRAAIVWTRGQPGILEGRRRVTTSSVLSFLPGSRAASMWTRGRSAGDYVARAVFFKSIIRYSCSIYLYMHSHSLYTCTPHSHHTCTNKSTTTLRFLDRVLLKITGILRR